MRLAVLFFLLPAAALAAPRPLVVGLGETFTLKKDQRAAFKGTDASVRVTGFINSPCPKGMRCVWGGQKVLLELAVAGATVSAAGFPYRVEVLGSDYKTRAELRAASRERREP